jgi:hypothetical protein
MSNVSYDVELIRQEMNPICWVASCAMAKGWGTQASIGVGEFTDGFDPSDSCIANLASSWSQCTQLMADWGFSVFAVGDLSSGGMTGDDLAAAVTERGPMVLLHLCKDFPYGSHHASSAGMDGAHAVVITAVDTDNDQVTFNNPWGDKDQAASLSSVLQKINGDSWVGATLGFWPV